jgi:hypothetical protein
MTPSAQQAAAGAGAGKVPWAAFDLPMPVKLAPERWPRGS